MRHLLNIEDLTNEGVLSLFNLAARLKRERGQSAEKPLAGKSVGLIFYKASTRTRVSFEVGIHELGGHPLFYDSNNLQIGRGETIADTARVLSRYLHAVIIRTFAQKDLELFAANSSVPVINGLTNEFHPCQALADAFTIYELKGRLDGVRLTYLGDGASNMANSLMLFAKLLNMRMTVCAPDKFAPRLEILKDSPGNGSVVFEKDPAKAVAGAEFLYTDVWVSMGFESEERERVDVLRPYQLNAALVAKAAKGARVLHCLPAHRGMEITDEVMDGPASIVFDQAENRLHVQKAVLMTLLPKA